MPSDQLNASLLEKVKFSLQLKKWIKTIYPRLLIVYAYYINLLDHIMQMYV